MRIRDELGYFAPLMAFAASVVMASTATWHPATFLTATVGSAFFAVAGLLALAATDHRRREREELAG